nr:unnamed protein product [Callosobruchus chinensis]
MSLECFAQNKPVRNKALFYEQLHRRHKCELGLLLFCGYYLARVDSSSPLCWSQAQEKREGWKPHFCKTTHTQNPQRNTTHRHQPRNSDLFKFFRGRTPGLIAWAVAMNKPG